MGPAPADLATDDLIEPEDTQPEPSPETSEPSEPTPAESPAEVEPEAHAGGRRGSRGGSHRRSAPAERLTAEQRRRLEQFSGSTGGGPTNIHGRPSPLDEGSQPRGTQLSSGQIRTVVTAQRHGVQRCYESAARQIGSAPDVRIDVEVTVGGSGTVTQVHARGQAFGTITQCIERTVRRWRFPRTGAESRIHIPFVFQGRD